MSTNCALTICKAHRCIGGCMTDLQHFSHALLLFLYKYHSMVRWSIMGSVLHLYWSVKCECLDRAIVEVEFCLILTMEAWVISQASACDMWWTKCHASRFFPSTLAFLCQLLRDQSFNSTMTRSWRSGSA